MRTFFTSLIPRFPLLVMGVYVVAGGVFFLDRQAAQARDTIRKHHLDDIEHALYFAQGKYGTYPPYELPTWCGLLNAETSTPVREQVEAALRESNTTYANIQKPFPTDPLSGQHVDYFYWKKSPAIFELTAILEAAPTGEKTTAGCPSVPLTTFDYGLVSVWRQLPPNQ